MSVRLIIDDHFARATRGGRSSFVLREPATQAYALRKMLEAAEDDAIMILNAPDETLLPPSLLRAIRLYGTARVRVLINDGTPLSSLPWLTQWAEVRHSPLPSPVQAAVTDKRHAWLNSAGDKHYNVSLNDLRAEDAARTLSKLWDLAGKPPPRKSAPVAHGAGRIWAAANSAGPGKMAAAAAPQVV